MPSFAYVYSGVKNIHFAERRGTNTIDPKDQERGMDREGGKNIGRTNYSLLACRVLCKRGGKIGDGIGTPNTQGTGTPRELGQAG